MSDLTAAEAVHDALEREAWRCEVSGDYEDLTTMARLALAALGIDPDSPLSLLHWHATQQERERCARVAENAGRANGQWIADQIRRSDRL